MLARRLSAFTLIIALLLSSSVVFAEGAVTPPQLKPRISESVSPSSIYGQGTTKLPAPGISVTDNTSLNQQIADSLDDYDQPVGQSVADPLEGWNRFWFSFNDYVYVYIADPLYSAWETATPKALRSGISNVWHNALFPVRFANNLLQFRFREAGVEFGRFIVNSTAGMGGLFDIAKNKKTIVPVHPEGEDFGQTLGRWGIPHGFYLVLPFVGPSSARELVGRVGDHFSYPAFAAGYVLDPWYLPTLIQWGFEGNDLDKLLPQYFTLKNAAVDPYIMVREAYIKHRAIQVAR